ncbi:ATP-binding protein [Chlorogloeopsis sp. ULAP02]|uniref:ATP-binding protein n=1 Tax=Chlorogloeopsis sp. ULAP02 TaxID=3107926 RepID=UPI003136292D
MNPDVKATVPEDLFVGGGEMGALMRSHNWSQTSLGCVENWPQSLKTAVRIMLTSRQAMFVWWGEELINLYNDAYKAILGGKHPQVLGQPASYVWREIWDQVAPRAESAMLTNEGTYDESLLLIMERNGYPEETYYTFSYSPIPNDDGGTGGIICANTDDTQRIIGERQLVLLRELAARAADARTFEQACTLSASCLETNPYDLPFAMIYLADPDQQRVNLAATCGIGREHPAVSETVTLDADAVWPFAKVLKKNKSCLVFDLGSSFTNLPTGAWKRPPHQAIAVPIAPSGQTGRMGILVVGLNPFRLFDDNYQRFIDLISAQIAVSIANAQAYEEERKRAEALAEIDQAKTVFFSNVSHEFRTPLTLMLGPLEDILAAPGELSNEHQQQLELVHRNSLRLLKLVNTLLDFSRIEAGRIQASYEPTDLATLTTELSSVFRSAIERAGLRLTVECEPLHEPVYVDRDMWEKIVLNLLSNAFKFTFEGEITVSLRSVENSVELVVRDTGTGIPAAELPHLFERFHRVQGARARTHEGSGIGLALVQELVRLHGGSVQVESIAGEGSTFTVIIPTGNAHLPPDSTSNRVQTNLTPVSSTLGAAPYVEEALRWLPEEEEGEHGKGGAGEITHTEVSPLPSSARILLVDDNADMRDYVKRLLSSSYQVEAVGDGMAALQAISDHLPDLVLSDVMMPRLDGFGLLKALRSDDRTRELPIILLSARAGEEAQIEGLEAGADDYLIKPFSAKELLARVRAHLEMAQLRQETAQREQVLRTEAETARDQVHNILESITDAFVAFDYQWRYTYVNQAAAQLLGRSPQELIGKQVWQEVFPTEVGGLAYRELHRAVAEQTPVWWEEFGEPIGRWLEVNAYPSVDGVAVYFRDISERKQIEEVLRESEAQFRQLADAMPQIVWITRANGEAEYVSQRWVEYTGLTLEQTRKRDFIKRVVHPDDFEPTYKVWNACLTTGALYQTEFRLKRALDSAYRWFLCRAVPIRDRQGQVVQWYGTLTDIDDRKQAEAALQQSEERYRYLAELIPQLVWTANSEGVLLDVNQRWLNFTGLTLAQAKTAGWQTIIHPDDIPTLSQNWAAAQQTGTSYLAEGRMRRADGVYRWHLHQAMPLKDEQGQIIKWFGTATDIEEQKQLEQQRSHLLQQEQAAREEAEVANRIKDEFLAVLSHELRSPLNPILGWAKLLQAGKLDEVATRRALETIERNAKLQTQLIEDLLDVSRILRGKIVLNISQINLATTIDAASETVRLAAQAKGIHIHKNIDANAAIVSGDSARLQQVVWNLLSNAIKFTPSGGRVEIGLEYIDSFAQITIKDTGKGISSEFLPYVFEYFRQEDGKTTRKFGGLGLGLAIVRHLTELHGGTVNVESRGEGMGAIFRVKLPLMKVVEEKNQDNLSSISTFDFSQLQILIVDDEADMRDLVLTILEQYGAQVSVAASATEALALLDHFQPDILISDIGMPDIDGYMLMQQIRNRSPKQGGLMGAIALTAYAAEYDQKQALQAGFQQHLAKPIEPEELAQAIVALIERMDEQKQRSKI